MEGVAPGLRTTAIFILGMRVSPGAGLNPIMALRLGCGLHTKVRFVTTRVV